MDALLLSFIFSSFLIRSIDRSMPSIVSTLEYWFHFISFFLYFLLHLVDDLRNTITTNNLLLLLLHPVLCADDEKFSSSFYCWFFSSLVFACSILRLLLVHILMAILHFVVLNWHAKIFFCEVYGSGLGGVLVDGKEFLIDCGLVLP